MFSTPAGSNHGGQPAPCGGGGGGARGRRQRRLRAEARLRLALCRGAADLASHRGGPLPPSSPSALAAEVSRLRSELKALQQAFNAHVAVLTGVYGVHVGSGSLAPGERSAPGVGSGSLAPGERSAPDHVTGVYGVHVGSGSLAPGERSAPGVGSGSLAPGERSAPDHDSVAVANDDPSPDVVLGAYDLDSGSLAPGERSAPDHDRPLASHGPSDDPSLAAVLGVYGVDNGSLAPGERSAPESVIVSEVGEELNNTELARTMAAMRTWFESAVAANDAKDHDGS
jgi:hypothetical protein